MDIINEVIQKERLSLFRKYFMEIVVVCLTLATINLYIGKDDSEQKLASYILEDKTEMLLKVVSNTTAMNENVKANVATVDLLREIRELLKEMNRANLKDNKENNY